MEFFAREGTNKEWQVCVSDLDLFEGISFSGSYNVLQSRVLGLTYPQYLKLCMSKFNGELRGRAGYSYCTFKNKTDCKNVCAILNRNWSKIEKMIKEKSE